MTRLAEMGEFGFISRINALATRGTGVVTGIGDDAAITVVSPGMQLLTSTDMLLEDVHFRRTWHDPYHLGRKSLAVNISDIAAMGGNPRWTTLSLAVPADLPLDFLDEFTRGFLSMAAEHGVSLVGGDTCASRSGLAVSVTIMGEQLPERILRRSGACPGDEIWVTGTLGDAALGLKLLEAGYGTPRQPAGTLSGAAEVISRLLDPTPRVTAGLALADSGLVSAMIDISDGLWGDYGHIAELSGVGGVIRLADVPVSDGFHAVNGEFGEGGKSLILTGGEDYELLFTAPAQHHEKIIDLMKKCGVQVTPVGIVNSLPEVAVLKADGSRFQHISEGFNHFRS